MAWVYSKDAALLRTEAESKEQKRGLWRDPDPVPPWALAEGAAVRLGAGCNGSERPKVVIRAAQNRPFASQLATKRSSTHAEACAPESSRWACH